MPDFDEKDQEILDEQIKRWKTREGPRVGDIVLMLDGTKRRFTYDWGDSLQTTYGDGNALFHFNGGSMQFSGSLDKSIKKTLLDDTGEIELGSAWFFHHNEMKVSNAVYFSVPCRVYKQRSWE